MSKPTFDEWYRKSHGSSFDEHYWYDDEFPIGVIKILSLRMREYVSEMVQPEAEQGTRMVMCDSKVSTASKRLREQLNPQWHIYAAADAERNAIRVDDHRAPPLTWKTERREERMQPHEWMELCARLPQPIESGFAHGRPYDHYEPIGDEV